MMCKGYVLIWGAEPGDGQPLFRGTDKDGVEYKGPEAGPFRKQVRESLQEKIGGVASVLFSEDTASEKYGHHEGNAGFFEPKQLEESLATILILPGNRPMAVNTWELALACEEKPDPNKKPPSKVFFIGPNTLSDYLEKLAANNVSDPKDFICDKEPVLGPQNSFAARWIYLSLNEWYGRSGPNALPPHWDNILTYSDTSDWAPDYTANLIERIADRLAKVI